MPLLPPPLECAHTTGVPPAQVRATNLQELVYKMGQAGVTKATVSVTFHNVDPQKGPAGYENKEFITITRQVHVACRMRQGWGTVPASQAPVCEAVYAPGVPSPAMLTLF